MTPAELILGKILQLPIDKFISSNNTDPIPFNKRQAAQFAKSLTDKINTTTDVVQHQLWIARTNMKQQYDKGSQLLNISIGDKVMLWNPYGKSGASKCFQPKWTGPWTVHSFTGKVACKIENDGNGQMKNVHVNQLKIIQDRYNSLQPNYTNTNTPNNDTNSSNNNVASDNFYFHEDNDEIERETEENIVPVPMNRNNIINEAWVDIDPTNIIQHRTVHNMEGWYSVFIVNKRPGYAPR